MRPPRRDRKDRREFFLMKKLLYLIGAAVCLIGLFYFVLMLTR